MGITWTRGITFDFGKTGAAQKAVGINDLHTNPKAWYQDYVAGRETHGDANSSFLDIGSKVSNGDVTIAPGSQILPRFKNSIHK